MVDARWWEPAWPQQLASYAVLLRAFVEHRLTAVEFETAFLSVFKHDDVTHPEAQFAVIDELVGTVDEYCSDEALRREVGGIDEVGLRRAASQAFDQLEHLLLGDTSPENEGES